jgi:GAF domain-containing protein
LLQFRPLSHGAATDPIGEIVAAAGGSVSDRSRSGDDSGGSVARGGILRDDQALLDTALALADLAHDDPDVALQRVAGELRDLTGSRFCAIYALERDELLPLVVNDAGAFVTADVPAAIPVAASAIAGAVRGARGPHVIAREYGAPICRAGEDDAASFVSGLVLPMIVGRELTGVVELCDAVARDYDGEVPLATRLVTIAARAARWAVDARRATAHAVIADKVLEFGEVIARARTLDEFARPILEHLRAATGAEDCDLWKAEGDLLTCIGSVDSNGWDDDVVGDEWDLKDYPSYQSAAASLSVRVVSSLDDPNLTEVELDSFTRWGFRSNLCLPLLVEDELVGYIDVFDTRPRDYAECLDYVRTIGRLLAGAFQKILLVDQVETANRDLRTVLEISTALTSAKLFDEALSLLVRKAAAALDMPVCILNEYVEEIDALVARASYDALEGEAFDGTGVPRHLDDFPGDREILERGEVVVEQVSDPDLDPATRESMEEWNEKTCLNIPLIYKGDPIGLLMFLETREEKVLRRHELELARAVGEQAALAIHNARLSRTVREKTETDDATGLHHGRSFRQRAYEEIARARRHGLGLSLVLVEIDAYRKFSLTHGREAADELLASVAAIVRGAAHPHVDIAAHLGSGKFGLLLPCAPLDGDGAPADLDESIAEDGWIGPHPHGAAGVAERIRREVAALTVLDRGTGLDGAVTVSGGVSVFGEATRDSDALLDAATAALRTARETGGDRIELAR